MKAAGFYRGILTVVFGGFFLLINDHYNRIVGGVCHKSVMKKAGRKIRVK